MKRLLLVALAAALLSGACGGDDGVLSGGGLGSGGKTATSTDPTADDADLNADEKAAAARVTSSIESDPETPEITVEQARCVGARVVGELGVERVNAIDWEADNRQLSSADALGMATALVSCVDVRPMMVEGLTEDGQVTTQQAECLSSDLTDAELVGFFVASFDDPAAAPDETTAAPLADAMLNCMDFGAVLVEEFTAGGEISESSAHCLAAAIPNSLLRSLLLAGMTGSDTSLIETAFAREVMVAAPACLTAEELSRLGG